MWGGNWESISWSWAWCWVDPEVLQLSYRGAVEWTLFVLSIFAKNLTKVFCGCVRMAGNCVVSGGKMCLELLGVWSFDVSIKIGKFYEYVHSWIFFPI